MGGAGCGVCPSQWGRHPLPLTPCIPPLAGPTFGALWVLFAGGHSSTTAAAGPRLPPLCETTDVIAPGVKVETVQDVGAEVYRYRQELRLVRHFTVSRVFSHRLSLEATHGQIGQVWFCPQGTGGKLKSQR